MSLLGRLLPQERRAPAEVERRTLFNSAFVPPDYDGIGGGGLVSEMRAMQSSAVWACVSLLADVIASMPWYVYKRDKNNIPQRIWPTPSIIRKPCPDMDLFDWKWMVVSSLALRGNSYHLVTARDATGYPTGLMPIHPDMVFLERRIAVLEWYNPIYRVLGERVPREDIIHMRRYTVAPDPYGLSPIQHAARTIRITLAAEEYGKRYFNDSANPSSILHTDQSLTQDEIELNQEQWMASHGGRRFPAILSGGFDWKPISISPEESQFLETRRYGVSDIARFYRIPPHLIGDQEKATSWGTGIESMNLGFHTYTLLGWLKCIENALSDFLPKQHMVQFDPSALLRGDFKSQVEAISAARMASLLSANEGRGMLERPPIPDGDSYIQPGNMTPLGFDPALVPMPKTVTEGTDGPATPTKAPAAKPAQGLEPEPGGSGHIRHQLQCRLRDGKPEYYDAHTGVSVKEVTDDPQV